MLTTRPRCLSYYIINERSSYLHILLHTVTIETFENIKKIGLQLIIFTCTTMSTRYQFIHIYDSGEFIY